MNKLTGIWAARADEAQEALYTSYWNAEIGMYNIETPCPEGVCNTIFHYWWMAHAVEVLVDGYERTGSIRYVTLLEEFHEGLLKRNGGAWPNELYDDMEWMAIAWLRAYEATQNITFKQTAITLWEDIKTGWNDHMGGGIAWQKSQLDYKNTPANAPAVILAVRLYKQFGDEEDMLWARKIYSWLKRSLVDPDSGFVWDGMNRQGDGSIDKDWEFTYCQGVFIGAAHELYLTTKDAQFLVDAERTAEAAARKLTSAKSGMLPNEGKGDGGLFKGIFIRYAANLSVDIGASNPELATLIHHNAQALWTEGRDEERTLFGPTWSEPPAETVELSTQLSGIILIEMAAKLERIEL
jgi:predicted alpha-1,6-mannanase (GH76 family)